MNIDFLNIIELKVWVIDKSVNVWQQNYLKTNNEDTVNLKYSKAKHKYQ